MPKRASAQLLNAQGRVTKHVFDSLFVEDDGIRPIFVCTETGAARAYGCLKLKVTRRELEPFFAALDWHPPLPAELGPVSVDSEEDDTEDEPEAVAAERAA